MLKFFMRRIYKDLIYTDEPELFYELYKWNCGLYSVLQTRYLIFCFIFIVIGVFLIISPVTRILGMFLLIVAEIFFLLNGLELRKEIRYNALGARTNFQVRTLTIADFIRKYFVSKNGKALSRSDWKKIKRNNKYLYYDLLSDECNSKCYYYSLEIGKVINGLTLIWGALEEPFEEGHNYYAHAVVMKNGQIYDSNMRRSCKFEDFVKLYHFKTYKSWEYKEYSVDGFRDKQRNEFRSWCKKNNVKVYERF